ncbi:YdeI/OmpD-associated family protein, partial [Streptomyces fimbriatus]
MTTVDGRPRSSSGAGCGSPGCARRRGRGGRPPGGGVREPEHGAGPRDLRAALDAVPAARDFFDALDSRDRCAVLRRTEEAERPQTRAARIERFVAVLAGGRKPSPRRHGDVTAHRGGPGG